MKESREHFSAPAGELECFLMPVQEFLALDRLPVHESVAPSLKNVRVAGGPNAAFTMQQEIRRLGICAVSWRWSAAKPSVDIPAALGDWTPMSDRQFARLKREIGQSKAQYVWIDWTCVPQYSIDTMRFINASHDIFSAAGDVVFLPRIDVLSRRGWDPLSPEQARPAVDQVLSAALLTLKRGTFSDDYRTIIRRSNHVDRAEQDLGTVAPGDRREVASSVAAGARYVEELLTSESPGASRLDYLARAWTLAERLAVFRPTAGSKISVARVLTVADLLSDSIAPYWRDQPHDMVARGGRDQINAAYVETAVYLRSGDPSEQLVRERWDDANRVVQIAPGIAGMGWNGALATICVEWLLHEKAGVSDELGQLAARLLGETVAFIAVAAATAKLAEQAGPEWFSQYLHFQAGQAYDATVPNDLILAIYRNAGLPACETAEAAVATSLNEVFGPPESLASIDPTIPDIARLCDRARTSPDVLAYLPSAGDQQTALSSSDFAPLMPRRKGLTPFNLASWQSWLKRSGVIVAWGFSNLDGTPTDVSEYVDLEHLYFGDASLVREGSIETMLAESVSVRFRLHYLSETTWALVEVGLARRDRFAAEDLATFRSSEGLETLLSPDLLVDNKVRGDRIDAWNARCLASLHDALHRHWSICTSSADLVIVS